MCPGEKVMLAYGAANRDPERFPDPEAFVVPRENNQHLTFGSGRHRCIGGLSAATKKAWVPAFAGMSGI